MSHEDDAINDLTFLQNLPRVPIQTVDISRANYSKSIEIYLGTGINGIGLNTTQLNNFITSFNKTTKPLPSTLDDFIAQLATYAQSLGKTVNTSNLLDAFLKPYVLFTLSDPNTPAFFFPNSSEVNKGWLNSFSSDWSIINPPPTKSDMINQMKAWYSHFFKDYTYNQNGGIYSLSSDLTDSTASLFDQTADLTNPALMFFREDLSRPLIATATLQNNVITFQNPTYTDGLTSYEAVYTILFPNASHQDFVNRVNQFYQDNLSKNGFFIPSQSYDDWTLTIAKESQKANAMSVFEPSSLASGNYEKPLIINRIYALIAQLLGTLQGIAAVQANRLVILSNWQKAYTDSLSQLHVFLQGDGTYLANIPNEDSNVQKAKAAVRADLNDRLNSNLRTLMQSNQGIVSDTAKAMQSNVNQTNDAVSQQANAATALIQELNTLLNAIFR